MGSKAPDFKLGDVEGKEVNLEGEAKRHKALFVTFFYCACPHCRDEMNALRPHYNDLKKQGLEVLAVDDGDSAPQVRVFDKEMNHPPFIILLQKGEHKHAVTAEYGVHGFPTAYIVGPDGTILRSFIGFKDYKDLGEAFKAVLG